VQTTETISCFISVVVHSCTAGHRHLYY
jgi:hypothetical protein